MSFRAIQRGTRARLAGFCPYYLLLPWVWVALLLCALEVTPRLLPVQGELVAPPTAWSELIFEMPQGSPPFLLNKGKGRIDEIKYPGGSEYLRSAVQNALVVGPGKVGPLYGATFARRYRPPFGFRVWSPDILTTYMIPVPKIVCFFEVAFDNGLRFPLHPFIKGVLQHFNVCPSQLSPNCWGILVGLLVFFRDMVSRPESRSDPIGGSELVSGTRDSGLGLFT